MRGLARRRGVTATHRVDMTTRVGSVTLPNPVMTASGTAGYGAELGPYLDLSSLGAVVVKSLAAFAWPGNAAPRVHPSAAGMINAVGLQGPGVEAWLRDELPPVLRAGARVVASIWGRSAEEFRAAADLLAAAPAEVVAVEVNLSCPNLEDRRHMFAHSVEATRQAMDATAGCRRPRWAKLSPNTADLPEIAAAAQEGGAEAVTLINTVLGLALDPLTGRPVLGHGGGGLVRAGHPPRRRPGGLRRPGGVAGAAHRRCGGRGQRTGRRRAADGGRRCRPGGDRDLRRPPGPGQGPVRSGGVGGRGEASIGSAEAVGAAHRGGMP